MKQLTGGNTIQNDKNINRSSNKYEEKCTPCKSGIRSLCYLQVQDIHSLRSQQNERIFTIFHQVCCKSDFVIYLLESKKCHIQYVENAETDFNIRLNSHRKDVYKADSIPASRHVAMKDHNCNRGASFIIIKQIRKSNLSRKIKEKFIKTKQEFLHPETRDFKT